MANEARVWYQDSYEQVGDEWRGPGGNVVGSNGKVRVRAVCLDGFDG